MIDQVMAGYRAQYAAIERRLDAGLGELERTAVKGEIVALFRSVEADIAELAALKEEIRTLVDKWKATPAAEGSAAPEFAAERPVVHADHIGASTFIEKGWSRLSLGDHEARSRPWSAPSSSRLATRRRRPCSAGRRCCRRSTTTR